MNSHDGTHYVGDDCPGGHRENDRGYQNNLDHARHVYLSVLLSTPPRLWNDEIHKIKSAAIASQQNPNNPG